MKPEQVQNQSCSTSSNISKATKEEIIKLFESYDFRDPHGHRLTMCEDFHDLLNNYITLKRRNES